MPIRRALNLITVRQAPFERKLEVAQAAGYQGVGLWLDEANAVASARAGVGSVAQMLREHALVAAELCFVSGWMYVEHHERTRSRDRALRAFQLARAVGCETVVACASNESGELPQAADDFRGLCELAQGFGVKLALEFIGGAEQVKDVRSAWEIVDLAGAQNGGLLLDTYHFCKGGSRLADLEPIPGAQIFLVHVSDCPDIPREELEDRHRVFPGLGALPLELMAAMLLDKGYRGFFSLELFNEDYWESDPFLVAQQGLRAMQGSGM